LALRLPAASLHFTFGSVVIKLC